MGSARTVRGRRATATVRQTDAGIISAAAILTSVAAAARTRVLVPMQGAMRTQVLACLLVFGRWRGADFLLHGGSGKYSCGGQGALGACWHRDDGPCRRAGILGARIVPRRQIDCPASATIVL